jgi:GMP synthase-like glutamine amidotransferase
MRVLSMVHGPLVRAEVFADATEDAGHELEEWSLEDSQAPPRPLDEYAAVFVFGGRQNVGEESQYSWLEDEYEVLRGLVSRGTPVFGVCLGAQTLAHALGANVAPSPEPEHGFVPVELTDAAGDDPVFSQLPDRFDAFQAHRYAFDVPPGAVELARSRVCVQAFRAGECAWGVQFHPEVRVEQVERWYADEDRVVPNRERVVEEARERFDWWNRFGANLCRTFLAAAERLAPVR